MSKSCLVRLNGSDYRELRLAILQRDGWRCQVCGSRRNLEVHHQQFRARLGSDAPDNLITLCHGCHSLVHGY